MKMIKQVIVREYLILVNSSNNETPTIILLGNNYKCNSSTVDLTLDEDDLLALLAQVKTKDRFDIEFNDNIFDVDDDLNHINYQLDNLEQNEKVKSIL